MSVAKINLAARAFQSRDGSIFFAAPGSQEDEQLHEECKFLGTVQLDAVAESSDPAWAPRVRERLVGPTECVIPVQVLKHYRDAIDAIYNHNIASRQAVIERFGRYHPGIVLEVLGENKSEVGA